jgi:hypothetical protein
MFCVTNATVNGTMPHPLDSSDPEQQAANRAHAQAWAARLCVARHRLPGWGKPCAGLGLTHESALDSPPQSRPSGMA